MLILSELRENDISAIKQWPPYPPEFDELDYALREGGWLDEFRGKPGTVYYTAKEGSDRVGFTLLSKTGENEAEFRIALRADKFGQGLGGIITTLTLQKGFEELGLERIHLIVRKSNPRAKKLYERLGFALTGEVTKEVHGKIVDFYTMDLHCPSSLLSKGVRGMS